MGDVAEKIFFVWSTSGIGYKVLLDPLEKNPDVVCEIIQRQLPACYANENFKVICQGKDLRYSDFFPKGIGHYFAAMLAGKFRPGQQHDSETTRERVYVVGRPWPECGIDIETANNTPGIGIDTQDTVEKTKHRFLAKIQRHSPPPAGIATESVELTMDSGLNVMIYQLALLKEQKKSQRTPDSVEPGVVVSRDEKIKLRFLWKLQTFIDKNFDVSKHFSMKSGLDEILQELSLLYVREAETRCLPVRQCIAHGCGNFLAPDEDLRCKICDY